MVTGADIRFIVTNLTGRAKVLYEKLYCARGRMENMIKDHKLYTKSDRTSRHRWEAWTAAARADISGVGISDTDLTWSITGGFDYRPWETTSLKFGWRAYSIDYSTTLSDGAFAYDVFEHGPFVAVTFRFQ